MITADTNFASASSVSSREKRFGVKTSEVLHSLETIITVHSTVFVMATFGGIYAKVTTAPFVHCLNRKTGGHQMLHRQKRAVLSFLRDGFVCPHTERMGLAARKRREKGNTTANQIRARIKARQRPTRDD